MKQVLEKNRLLSTLVLLSASSLVLYLVGFVFYDNTRLWFLNWNLVLAWLPLLFAWKLKQHLKNHSLASTAGVAYSLLWLGFLPNSFYIASDLIHLRLATSSTALFYIVLILSFTLTGFMLGFLSLYLVHKELLRRATKEAAHTIVALVLLLCSFAIYLGRYLRWNTWDVFINPAGILFDVSDRFINPAAHEQTFRITILLFILLGTTYTAIWQLIQVIRESKE